MKHLDAAPRAALMGPGEEWAEPAVRPLHLNKPRIQVRQEGRGAASSVRPTTDAMAPHRFGFYVKAALCLCVCVRAHASPTREIFSAVMCFFDVNEYWHFSSPLALDGPRTVVTLLSFYFFSEAVNALV